MGSLPRINLQQKQMTQFREKLESNRVLPDSTEVSEAPSVATLLPSLPVRALRSVKQTAHWSKWTLMRWTLERDARQPCDAETKISVCVCTVQVGIDSGRVRLSAHKSILSSDILSYRRIESC